LEDIVELGFERILTSGLLPKAIDGKQTIFELISTTKERIIIMPGSGIKSDNLISIAESTGATEFHSSASVPKQTSMEYQNAAMNESLKHVTIDKEEVQKMVQLLKEYRKKV
jgi:copper homeostasis protein